MKQIKNLLARYQLRRQCRQLEPGAMVFPAALLKPKHVLVCLPPGLRELTAVKQFLPTIADLFRPADLTLLGVPGVRLADIFPRKGFQILSPTPDQQTWSGLARKTYLNMMSEMKFDLVLDLNFESTHFTSSVLLNFPQAVRIGRGNHLGQPFYNLEIKTKYLRDERNVYRSLFETIRDLKNAKQVAG